MSDSIVKSVFEFSGQTLRVAGTAERPLFRASDVCQMIGVANVTDACNRLDQDEIENFDSIDVQGKTRPIVHVTESGLYGLILGGRKAEAKAFRRWVTEVVLPEIRKTGSYSTKALTMAEQCLAQAQAMVELERAQAEQARQLAEVEDRIGQLESGANALAEGTGYISIVGWLRARGRKAPSLGIRATMGREATAECKRIGCAVGTVPDDRFGVVNTYPADLLDELFGESV